MQPPQAAGLCGMRAARVAPKPPPAAAPKPPVAGAPNPAPAHTIDSTR
jgi:hypothetical protein